MEENIKNLTLFLAVIVIASLGYYYYQDYTQPDMLDNGVTEQEASKEGTETTTTAPAKKTTTAPVSQLPKMTEEGIHLVYYFNDGFSPSVLQIRQGASVRFVNKSDNAMRVFNTNTSEYKFNQLNQSQSVGREGAYDFTFLDKDVWTYFNQTTQTHNASILVY